MWYERDVVDRSAYWILCLLLMVHRPGLSVAVCSCCSGRSADLAETMLAPGARGAYVGQFAWRGADPSRSGRCCCSAARSPRLFLIGVGLVGHGRGACGPAPSCWPGPSCQQSQAGIRGFGPRRLVCNVRPHSLCPSLGLVRVV